MTLEDGTEVTIESEMAEDIARVHDTLTRENQISFRDEITLNEESFERMINFVNKAIQKLNSEEEQ
jgi:BarA-like signal transduction histidine kinase